MKIIYFGELYVRTSTNNFKPYLFRYFDFFLFVNLDFLGLLSFCHSIHYELHKLLINFKIRFFIFSTNWKNLFDFGNLLFGGCCLDFLNQLIYIHRWHFPRFSTFVYTENLHSRIKVIHGEFVGHDYIFWDLQRRNIDRLAFCIKDFREHRFLQFSTKMFKQNLRFVMLLP